MHTSAMPMGARRGHWIPWSQSYRKCKLLDLGAKS